MQNSINCPICSYQKYEELVYLKDFPISNLGLSSSREEALTYKTYDMSIVFCQKCTHIYNRLPLNMDYKQNKKFTYFTNSKQKDYIKMLVNDFTAQYALKNKKILEIGSGDGLFLEELHTLGNICIGYEPSYNKLYKRDNLTIINDYFVADKDNLLEIDWIIIRHVLEHFEDVYLFLEKIISELLQGNPHCQFFIEVPNIQPTLDNARINDFIHEHISHFSLFSLKYLLHSLNLDILDIHTTASHENLVAICKINRDYYLAHRDLNDISDTLINSISLIKSGYQQITQENKVIAIWGAEGRGSSFINIIKEYLHGDEIIVDSDERKFNQYIPSIGLKISSFKVLIDKKVEALIITTSIGKDNILKEINEYNIEIKNIYLLSKDGLSKIRYEEN